MKFVYPRACNWILSKHNQDETYTLKDCLCGCEYTLGSTIGYLWRNLDGETDPFAILPKCSKREILSMMKNLEKEDLIRNSRVLVRSIGNYMYSLFIPSHQTRRSIIPVLLNYILFVSWLPVFALGLFLFFDNFMLFDTSLIVLGQLAGLLIGCICHEIGHAISCLALGGRFLEAGFLFQNGLPGAYVLLDDSHVKRVSKIQIHAAGVEMNLLIAGIALVFAVLFPSVYGFFFGIFLNNLLLALLNLTFIDSLDGMHIIETVLGYHPLDVVKSKESRRALKDEGLPGVVELCICYILKVLQLAYPVLLLLNVVEVALWIVHIH